MPAFPCASRFAAALLLVPACLRPQAGFATDPVDGGQAPPAHTLDAVVVTAQAPVSPLTYVTDPRRPRQPMPAADGADYLDTIPGFTAFRNGGTNGDPVLRGMFGSRLNLLSNDGAMPGACPGRMDNPLSYVAPETYDRLVVVKGPQTVLWGPGASAGTVRFERSAERFERPAMRLRGSLLEGSAGRNDQVLDATFGTPTGYARASANRSASDDYRDGDGHEVPSEWKKWAADLALGWTPDEDTLLEARVGAGDGRARYAARGMDGTRFERRSLGLRFEKRGLAGPLDALQASAYDNLADHVMDNYSMRDPDPAGPMSMPMGSNVDRRTQGGRVALDWHWERLALTVGADAQLSRHRERTAPGKGAYHALPWAPNADMRNVGVFSEATWTQAAGRRWVVGARMDRSGTTDRRRVLPFTGIANPTFGRTRRETLPAGFLRYEHDAAQAPLAWFAGIGHTGRSPDFWERFSAVDGPDGALNAFDGVDPERTTQVDVGLQYRSRRMDAWISAYAGRITDYILFSYAGGEAGGYGVSVANVDARTHGAEAGIELRPGAAWKLGGSLAWAWGENRGAGAPLPQMPPLELRLSAAYEGGRANAGVLLRGVAAQGRVDAGRGNVIGRDLGPSGGFATLAAHAGVRLGARVQLTAGVDNLFDRRYSEHLNLAGSADFGYPADPVRIAEPGRSAWLKLDFSY